jgi:glycosyltransferase involved in cell wall biosynthesis
MTAASVLYVNPTAQLGGAEYSLLDLMASLDRNRFAPRLVCPEGPLVPAAAARGIAVTSLEIPHWLAQLSLKGERSGAATLAASAFAAAPTAWKLRRLAADAAIVHTNGNKAHLLAGLPGPRARLVWHVRDFWRKGAVERGMVRFANSQVDALIANSNAVRAHLIGMGLSRDLVHAVPNGIDAARFTPDGPVAPLRQEFAWPANTPLVGIVGMLARWKGQDVLLRAFAEVLRRRPDARCVIAGDEIYVTRGHGGFRAELQTLARDLDIEHAVAMVGYRDDVPAVLRALNVVVHASVEPEPFGRVIAEAMASGRAVIAADAGGVPEVTGRDSAAAVLVPPGDVASLSHAIVRLLGDDGEARRLGRAGRARVIESFSIAAHVDGVQALYDRLLSATAVDPRPAVVPGGAV